MLNTQSLFTNEVQNAFSDYCTRKEVDKNMESMLQFMTTHNFITSTTRKYYVINRKFGQRKIKRKAQRSIAINAIAEEFRMDESSIRNILKKTERKYAHQ